MHRRQVEARLDRRRRRAEELERLDRIERADEIRIENELEEKYGINIESKVHFIFRDILDDSIFDDAPAEDLESIFNIMINKITREADKIITQQKKEDRREIMGKSRHDSGSDSDL